MRTFVVRALMAKQSCQLFGNRSQLTGEDLDTACLGALEPRDTRRIVQGVNRHPGATQGPSS